MNLVEALKAEVAATKGAGPSVRVLINGIVDGLTRTMEADGLKAESETGKLVAALRVDADILAHFAEIGTIP